MPVCSPSQADLATGRYASELGLLDGINPRAELELGLNPVTVTWMELLQAPGDRTALCGEWLFGSATILQSPSQKGTAAGCRRRLLRFLIEPLVSH